MERGRRLPLSLCQKRCDYRTQSLVPYSLQSLDAVIELTRFMHNGILMVSEVKALTAFRAVPVRPLFAQRRQSPDTRDIYFFILFHADHSRFENDLRRTRPV